MRNLRGAEAHLDERGLFSGPYWNMFDWSPIDDRHYTVLHNSLLLIGALDAAQACGKVLKKTKELAWLKAFRRSLVRAINALWDGGKRAYPDSVHNDGKISRSISQHTSFLGVLYDVVTSRNRRHAVRNMLHPPKGMVEVGSPFAIQYLFEALEKAGRPEVIIASMRERYVPMLETGATTVWETFPESDTNPTGWPTRSHCHAWSASPLYFLPRILLGIRQTAPGGKAFDVSPRPCGLTHAEGRITTAKGPLSVAWRIEGKTLHLRVDAPPSARIRVTQNPALKGLRLVRGRY